MTIDSTITKQEFDSLSTDLERLAPIIPQKWGIIQNNRYDDVIPGNVFFNTYELDSLEDIMENCHLDEEGKQYFRRRWFITRCADCDEYLFYSNPNVRRNPNKYDKAWDIEFYGDPNLRFDVKGTLFPEGYRKLCKKEAVTEDFVDETIQHTTKLADWMYDNQSKGRRFDIQNRLFIIHHSFISDEHDLLLRVMWDEKKKMIDSYVTYVGGSPKFIHSHNVLAGFLWLLECVENIIVYLY